MNATIIVAASSILLACVAFAFFMLQGGSDELAGVKSGSMSFSGDGNQLDVKFQVDDAAKTTTLFVENGIISALWVKTELEGNYISEETYETDAFGYSVVEFENGVVTSCRINKSRDAENINKMIDSIAVGEDEDASTYTITEENFDGDPVELSVTVTVGDVTMPEFDWSTCLDIGDPINPFVEDSDSRRVLEAMVEAERALGETTAGNLAQGVYEIPTAENGVLCFPVQSVEVSRAILDNIDWRIKEAIERFIFGQKIPSTSVQGDACYKQSGCNFAFRGSDDNADWVDNIAGAWLNEVNVGGVQVHAGFYNQFNKLRIAADLDSKVRNCPNPTFIGHSLGGAIANVARHYYQKGTINTYAGASPFKGHVGYKTCHREKCSGWGPWKKCRQESYNCPNEYFTTGKRTYHEYDPVPYLANFEGFKHGGGNGYRIAWKCTRGTSWDKCGPFDWCCEGGHWEVHSEGTTNNPEFSWGELGNDAAWNAASLGFAGWLNCDGKQGCYGTHFHSMNVHYQPYGQ